MKSINEIVSLTQFEKYAHEQSSVVDLDEEKIKKVLNRLFTRFERIFNKFWVNIKSQEHLNGIKDEWFECFQRAKLNNQQILYGILRAQDSKQEYLPKASVFIGWCTNIEPAALGFPTPEIAYNISIAINSQFSVYKHPDERTDKVIRHTIEKIGKFAYRAMKFDQAIKAFDTHYALAIKDYLAGKINKMIEDGSDETQELIKQESIVKETYKDISRESAFAAMKNILKR